MLYPYCFAICTGSSTQLEMNAMLQAQENSWRELECIICLEVPGKETQVFSCTAHHLICSYCNKHALPSLQAKLQCESASKKPLGRKNASTTQLKHCCQYFNTFDENACILF